MGIIQNVHDKVCVAFFLRRRLRSFAFQMVSQRAWEKIYNWLGMKNLGAFEVLAHYKLFTQALQGKNKKKKLSLCWLTTLWSI